MTPEALPVPSCKKAEKVFDIKERSEHDALTKSEIEL